MAAKKKAIEKHKPSFDGQLVSTPDIDGWWSPEEGDFVEGRVMGAIRIKNDLGGGMRDVVLIKVKGECANCVIEKEKGQTLKEGQIVAVGIKAKNKELLDFVELNGMVSCQFMGKVPLKGGRTLAQFEVVGEKNKRKMWTKPVETNDGAEDSKGDDIPF